MTPEKKELIEARIKKSNEFYQKRKAKEEKAKEKRKAFKAFVHEGNKAVDKLLFSENKQKGFFFSEDISFKSYVDILCVQEDKIDDRHHGYVIYYAKASKKDDYRLHIGRGLCGQRYLNNTKKISSLEFNIVVPDKIAKNRFLMQRLIADQTKAEMIISGNFDIKTLEGFYLD
jgi:hypothetical protein